MIRHLDFEHYFRPILLTMGSVLLLEEFYWIGNLLVFLK
jgi:hypothetical protein